MLHDARRAGHRDVDRPPLGAGDRRHLPEPRAAGQDGHHARRRLGRPAILGIGAGWAQLEHDALGFEFGRFTDRFARLEEALQIVVPMLAGERPTFDGTWYRVDDAVNEPRLRERVPVMIGGSGENKTFRLAARFADHVNLICPVDAVDHKVDVLARRCEEIGRDPQTPATSFLVSAVPVDSDADVRQVRAGLTPYLPEFAVVGTPGQIAGHVTGTVEAVGKELAPLVRAQADDARPGRRVNEGSSTGSTAPRLALPGRPGPPGRLVSVHLGRLCA